MISTFWLYFWGAVLLISILFLFLKGTLAFLSFRIVWFASALSLAMSGYGLDAAAGGYIQIDSMQGLEQASPTVSRKLAEEIIATNHDISSILLTVLGLIVAVSALGIPLLSLQALRQIQGHLKEVDKTVDDKKKELDGLFDKIKRRADELDVKHRKAEEGYKALKRKIKGLEETVSTQGVQLVKVRNNQVGEEAEAGKIAAPQVVFNKAPELKARLEKLGSEKTWINEACQGLDDYVAKRFEQAVQAFAQMGEPTKDVTPELVGNVKHFYATALLFLYLKSKATKADDIKLDKSLEIFSLTEREGFYTVEFYINFGTALMEKGDYSKALLLTEQAKVLAGKAATMHEQSFNIDKNLANLKFNLGQVDQAIDGYQKLIEGASDPSEQILMILSLLEVCLANRSDRKAYLTRRKQYHQQLNGVDNAGTRKLDYATFEWLTALDHFNTVLNTDADDKHKLMVIEQVLDSIKALTNLAPLARIIEQDRSLSPTVLDALLRKMR